MGNNYIISKLTLNTTNHLCSAQCLAACQADFDLCSWFTYNVADGACVLLSDCDKEEDDCPFCLSGQTACSKRKGG